MATPTLYRSLPTEQRSALDPNGVHAQLNRLPADATHLVLSAGGNDALRHVDLLMRHARTGGEALTWFDEAARGFASDYGRLLEVLARAGHLAAVCTIYEGQLEPELQPAARAALGIFNDVIQRVANRHGFPVIELRDVCTEPGDYANPIEPSVQGGRKIAEAIVRRLDASFAR